MQTAESSSRRYDEELLEDDKLDKLAESSSSKRRLSTTSNNIDSNTQASRRMSMSNGVGVDKGKSRLQEKDFEHDEDMNDAVQDEESEASLYESDDDESIHCAICLSVIDDRTVVQPCCHDAYCFVCILAWTEQSRRCPLCVANIELLIHNIRGEKDFQKSDSPPPERSLRELREGARRQLFNRPTHPRFKYADWKARNRPAALPDVDAEDLALEKRRYVYKHGLYVKHVAANRYTRFRDWSAQQVSSTPDLKQRLAKWLRRELRVFDGVDLAFLVDYCTNIASQLELRSDSATRLLAEFLGEEQAEHFWHETYSFLRSPFKDIRQYDKAVQYDRPPCKIDEAKRETETHPQASSKARRSRSRSISSASEASSRSDRSLQRPRRGDDFRPRKDLRRSVRDSPPRRVEGDSYIPSYSRLNKARPPPRKRRDRRPSRTGPLQRGDNGWQRQRGPEEERRERPRQAPESAQAMEVPKEPEPTHESEYEDEISLGSDIDTAPLVTPKDVVHATNGSKQESIARQPALAIRGIAHSRPIVNNEGNEVDLIRDFGPDLLSRLSGPRDSGHGPGRSERSSASHLAPQSGPANRIQMKGRGFRKGLVNKEMHATLMARLSEEKLHSANLGSLLVSPQSGKEVDEKTEASLREHVLQVLKQRRQPKAQAASIGTNGHQAPVRPQEKKDTQSAELPNGKASRLALLQARLAKERAAANAAASTKAPERNSTTPVGDIKAASPPAATDAASRMAELKKRLAEQKAMREKA